MARCLLYRNGINGKLWLDVDMLTGQGIDWSMSRGDATRFDSLELAKQYVGQMLSGYEMNYEPSGD